jgi:pheromone receptor transcription factor
MDNHDKDEVKDEESNDGELPYQEGDDDDSPTPKEVKSDRPPQKRAGRRKINIEFIKDKSRRHITFSKRKAGIMKKAYELSTLTGTQVLLLVASETGHVYTFATPKLQPLITKTEGKNLIQACLNAPDPQTLNEQDQDQGTPMPSGMGGGQQSYGIDMEEKKPMRGDMKGYGQQMQQMQQMPPSPSPQSYGSMGSQHHQQLPSMQNQGGMNQHPYSPLDMAQGYGMQPPQRQDFGQGGNFGGLGMGGGSGSLPSHLGGGGQYGGGSGYGMNPGGAGGMGGSPLDSSHKVTIYGNPSQYHQQN